MDPYNPDNPASMYLKPNLNLKEVFIFPFTFTKSFSSRKTKLKKSSHPTTELVVSLIINHEEHLIRALADTAARSSIILEA
jgi:hypothetical protein